MPPVSIIIPTRNRAHLIARAVDSARAAASDAEIIVVDDASEDETAAVCAGLPNARYLRTRVRLGPGGARNVGILFCTSDYLAFLDDDDLRLPGSIDAQINVLQNRPDAGLIYGKTLFGDQKGHATGDHYPEQCPSGDVFWQLMQQNFIPCPTVVFRRACLLRVGMLDEEASEIADWDLWLRIAELYPVLALPQPVAIWRQSNLTSEQMTSRPDQMHKKIYRLHRDKWTRLERVLEAGVCRRRETSRRFADRMTEQLIWESVTHLKFGTPACFARLVLLIARLYTFAALRKILRASTWSFVFKRRALIQARDTRNY